MAGDPVAAYLATQPPRIRGLAEGVRAWVRGLAPELDETLKWGQPTYVFGTHNVLYVAAYPDHVDLGFFDGADLPDPHRVLEGSGARMRHVKVRDAAALEEPALKALVRAAVERA